MTALRARDTGQRPQQANNTRLSCAERGRITFDMSGMTRQAKPAVACPLDGGVRPERSRSLHCPSPQGRASTTRSMCAAMRVAARRPLACIRVRGDRANAPHVAAVRGQLHLARTTERAPTAHALLTGTGQRNALSCARGATRKGRRTPEPQMRRRPRRRHRSHNAERNDAHGLVRYWRA